PEQHQSGPARGLARARGRGARRLADCPGQNGDHAVMQTDERPPVCSGECVGWLRREGERRYHDRHPFHVLMHDGNLSKAQLQQWVLNRYYYQSRVPIKDAIILSKSEDPGFRRSWIQRIHDHDGDREGEGGLALWLRLAEGVGLDRDRKSTRLNSSHRTISYAVFCLK